MTSFNWTTHIALQPTNKLALVTAHGGMTYGELNIRLSAVRTLLMQKGLKPGQQLLLGVTDERQLLCILLGAMSMGVVPMLMDTDLPQVAASDLVDRFQPHCAVVDQQLAQRWALSCPTWAIEAEPAPQKGALLKRLLSRQQRSDSGFFHELDAVTSIAPPVISKDAEIALIFFTSGSTSIPKAVQLSYKALATHLGTLQRQHSYVPTSRILNTLPLHHADGMVQGPLVAIFSGATLLRPLAFSPVTIPRFLDLIYAESISHLVVVPTMLALMLRLGARQQDSFAHAGFKHIISTAGHLEETLWRQFEEQFQVVVVNTYGLTETVAGGIFSGPTEATRKLGTLGKPVDCVVRIIDENGEEVKQSETGELLIQGDHLMSGYYLDPVSTAATIKNDWLHTGDLVWSDADGFLHFAGRVKNIIVCGGHNIHPEEVDDVLSRHPDVMSVATLGLPHAEWESIVVSAVVPVAGTHPTESQLLEFCRSYLPPYKLPRKFIFMNALPYGPSGKVRLETLRALCINEGASIDSDKADADQVLMIAQQIFRLGVNELKLTSGPDNTVGWDSLAHIEFVSALENHFDIVLDERDITGITHIGAAIDIIRKAKKRG